MATTEQINPASDTLKVQDGTELFVRSWPLETARANIAVAHGYGEHSGRYDHIAARFNARGYGVYAYDHRGHGRSPGTMGYIPSFDQLVEDFSEFYAELSARLKRSPEFIFGHSMGALVAALYTERHNPALHGLVLSSGAFKVDEDTAPLLQKLSTFLATFLPKLPVHQIDPAGLSHNSEEVTAYESDPLVYHGKLTARTGYVMIQAIRNAIANASTITHPVLLLHGTDDRVAVCDGSRDMHAAIGSSDKTLKLYDGAYHEVFNDDRREDFFEDMLGWMDARI